MGLTIELILIFTFLIDVEASARCKVSTIEINCSSRDLEVIPKFKDPGRYEILDMGDNDIEELFKVDFYNFTNLKHLRLNFNEIAYIEDTTFENLLNLESLDLSKNILEEVPDEIVENNKKLLSLDLSGNLFNGRSPCLISKSLEILDLSTSKISYFNEENIANLPNLKVLNLSSNKLTSLNGDIFKITRNLISVDLYFNTWECSCEVVKMFKKLTEEKKFEVTKNIVCFRGTKIEEIYGKNGIISKKLSCDKKKNLTAQNPTKTTTKNDNKNNNDSLINGIKSLEEILKMEKIYYQELRKEKDVLVTVTSLTMKILIVVIFITGISLGILISTVMDRRISRIRRGVFRSDSFS